MNRYIAFGVSIFLVGVTGSALAATQLATPVASPKANTAVSSIANSPVVHNLNGRLKQDMEQIQKDLKSGKLTKTQAESLKTQVKAIRATELQDMKSNGTRQLTASQTAELNSQLDQLQSSI